MAEISDAEFDKIFDGSDGDPREFFRGLATLVTGNGGTPITGEEVAFHDGKQIVLPNGMTFERAIAIFMRMYHDRETVVERDHVTRFRTNDGLYACIQVIEKRYGIVFGEATAHMFGEMPPETRTIAIGVDETVTVPWGHISIPSLPGLEMVLHEQLDEDYGRVFAIHAHAAKKYKQELDEFFAEIDAYLKEHSIYRGKVIIGADSPEFFDMRGVDETQIVFAADVLTHLDIIWAPILYRQVFLAEKMPLKRTALLYGPFGTGKSSIGRMTASRAIANGWTVIIAKPGRDSVEDLLRFARLYGRCVLVIEDIEKVAKVAKEEDVTKLLDSFDGITNKGGELVVIMTSNHEDRIHKGMLRPGRLDVTCEVAELDRTAIEQLIKAVVPSHKLAAGVDYDEIVKHMRGFLPAFVKEAIERARSIAIVRGEGSREYVLDTDALTAAADSLVKQLALFNAADEGEQPSALDAAMQRLARKGAEEALGGTRITGDVDASLVVNGATAGSARGHTRQ